MFKISVRNGLLFGIFFFAAYLIVSFLLKNQPVLEGIFVFSMIAILYSLVAICLYLATITSAIYGKRTQLAWTILTIAVLTSVVGNILWGILVLTNQNPSNTLANILYLMFFPIFLIRILVLPSSYSTNRQKFKRYFDIVIILFSISLALWIFLIVPAFQHYNGDFSSLIFDLMYILGGFLLVLAMLDLLFNRIYKEMYVPFLIILVGVLVLITTECVYVYQTIHGTYVPGSPTDLGWLIGYLILGLAGISMYTHQKIDSDNFIIDYISGKKTYTITPYIALGGISMAYISLIWAYNTFNPDLTFLEFGIGILIFLVISRQFLSINENKHLYSKAQEEIILRKEVTKSLRNSESAYRTIFENTGTATVIINDKNLITLANTEFVKLSGYPKDDIEGKMFWTDFVVIDDLEPMLKHNNLRITDNQSDPKNYEFRLSNKLGVIKNIFVVAVIMPGSNNSLVSLLDVTKRRNAEAEIKKSLKEKETLLKEIHHRVKNNLTVISSLLNLQSHYIKDKDDLIMFKESQSRAKSMALIHQKIYSSTDLKRINFGDYIKTLSNDIFRSYVHDSNVVKLNLDVEDIMLDTDITIPLGLILNELLTNSLKYAFPSNAIDNGNIDVSLLRKDNGYTLCVADDGIGFPENIDLESTDSLGLQLITTLTHQIDGKIYLDQSNGTSFKIDFNEMEYYDKKK
jgi:PAS domain S-box-containing protein